MKLRSVRLHPFAGIQDRSFEFRDGLNVLQGPNEAGKSTLFNALYHGLLTDSNMTTRQMEKTMGAYFPSGGGDVIRVSIGMETDDGESLNWTKTWKKGNREGSAEMTLDDGTEIADRDEVQRRIEDQLPVSPATLETVFLADQSSLQETVERMEAEGEVREELGEVLRQGVMETGGVSLDRLRELLEDEYENFFKRWDTDQEYPENGRGISNPYQKDKGWIVDAFYKKERIRLEEEEVADYEAKMERIEKELEDLEKRYAEAKKAFDRLQPLKDGVQKRQNLEHEKEKLEGQKETLKKINEEWPQKEQRFEKLPKELEDLEQKLQALEKEKESQKKLEEYQKLSKRVEQVKALKKELDDKQKELDEATPIKDEQVKELRKYKDDIQRLEAKKEGAEFHFEIKGTQEGHRTDFQEYGKEDSETLRPEKGESIERTVSGGFRLEGSDFELEVRSGDEDMQWVLDQLEVNQKRLKERFQELGVKDIDDAQSWADLYRDKVYQRDQKKKELEKELGQSESLESLEKKLAEFELPEEVREADAINDELVDIRTKRNKLQEEKDELEKQLGEWKEKYQSHDQLLEELGTKTKRLADIEKELQGLPELPEGFEDAASFVREVEKKDQECRDLRERIADKREEKAGQEGKAPERSVEELREERKEAEEEFQRIREEGETIARIRDKALEMMETMDADTYGGLERSFKSWLATVTGKRFTEVRMEEDLPEGFENGDGEALPYELLSHGTKGSVALAWRFALCEHFLQESTGFMTLDDPLVDMDPERQKQAVEALKAFSEKEQVLLMTCHPEDLVGVEEENVLELER